MKHLRAALPLALIVLLAACGGTGPTTPTPEPTPIPAPVPSPTPTPTPTPPAPVPTPTPTPMPTPTDPNVEYAGDWVWIAIFEDDSSRSGYLTITEAADTTNNLLVGGQGGYLECENNDCESALANPVRLGTGAIGDFNQDDGTSSLTTAFENDGGFLEIIAFDSDNAIGNELDGDESFIGAGAIFTGPDSEGREDIVLGLARLSNVPALPLSAASIGLTKEKIAAVRAATDDSDIEALLNKVE